MKRLSCILIAAALAATAQGSVRPVPRKALVERMNNGPDVIGIVHWGLNTYTDREWGYGDVEAARLDEAAFDAGAIVEAAKAGGIGGIVFVAKHHDGFCLWPTKTTDYHSARDCVKEMSRACRRAGLKFGVYVSPWDRHDADYATERYVEKYHAQIKELLGGGLEAGQADYGEVFEMWFDGANGGTGWYGGAKERRTIGKDYYRFGEVLRFVRELQPGVTIFGGGTDGDFRWPGNERGFLDPDSRATCPDVANLPGDEMRAVLNKGSADGAFFRVCEADFPLRKGWFWHERERGTAKGSAYLAKLYLSSVGNGGTMNIGLAPNKNGVLDEEDAKALAGFKIMKDALFAHEAKAGGQFNVVVMREDISLGERIDGWRIVADGREILSGKAIGAKRIRVLREPEDVDKAALETSGGSAAVRFYHADTTLVGAILDANADSGETDTAKWMTGKGDGR